MQLEMLKTVLPEMLVLGLTLEFSAWSSIKDM